MAALPIRFDRPEGIRRSTTAHAHGALWTAPLSRHPYRFMAVAVVG